MGLFSSSDTETTVNTTNTSNVTVNPENNINILNDNSSLADALFAAGNNLADAFRSFIGGGSGGDVGLTGAVENAGETLAVGIDSAGGQVGGGIESAGVNLATGLVVIAAALALGRGRK